ncbi:MAG TPA: putative glycolipid-binding domain-containing protein [Aggregatilineales bacterium]|nr:putative glycolipid-binding domain-containing protein [Aggregatilineales bacterium]
MMTSLVWENRAARSLEYCNWAATETAFVLEGTVILFLDRLPARVTYRVEGDGRWRTRAVTIQQELAGATKYLTLEIDDKQVWHTAGAALAFATGLYDIDLEITPATNTIPIRRMGLGQGDARSVEAVWVRFPSLTLEPLQQRYTRLDRLLYRYEGLSIGYETLLEVDESGLVRDYRGLWRQVHHDTPL